MTVKIEHESGPYCWVRIFQGSQVCSQLLLVKSCELRELTQMEIELNEDFSNVGSK